MVYSSIGSRNTSLPSRLIIFFMVALLVFSPFLAPPKKAEAQLGQCGAAIATNLFGGWVSGAVGSVLSTEVPVRDSGVRTSTAAIENKEGWLDACGRAILKVVFETVLNDITTWVKGGFNGSPMFAQDLRKTLENFADGEAGAFLSQLSGVDICDPSYLNLLLNLQTKKSVQDKYKCTLTIAQANLDAFYDDFSQGGWLAYEQSLTDQNNAGGFIIKGSADIGNKIAKKETNILAELSWSKGFFGQKDETGKTLTPGAVVQDRLGKSLNSDIAQYELADEFDELLGAVLDQAVKQIFTGAKGLFD